MENCNYRSTRTSCLSFSGLAALAGSWSSFLLLHWYLLSLTVPNSYPALSNSKLTKYECCYYGLPYLPPNVCRNSEDIVLLSKVLVLCQEQGQIKLSLDLVLYVRFDRTLELEIDDMVMIFKSRVSFQFATNQYLQTHYQMGWNQRFSLQINYIACYNLHFSRKAVHCTWISIILIT